ncbi:MAG: hypothetical protein ACM3VZ_06130 [Acidobacteriota bacterium]
MQPFIRTALKNEVVLDVVARERGCRFWSSVELPSESWFVVEVCIDGPTSKVIKHFIALSIDDVKRIQQGEEQVRWTQVFLGMRAPLNSVSGVIFELLEEVHHNTSSGQYVYKLASGFTFSVEPSGGLGLRCQEGLDELRLVYRRR